VRRRTDCLDIVFIWPDQGTDPAGQTHICGTNKWLGQSASLHC